MKKSRVTVIGTGYVGLVTAACLAHIGHLVMGLDTDESKINRLQKDIIPIHEPGLNELISRLPEGSLTFTTDYATAVRWGEVIIVAVGTPSDDQGDADLSAVWNVVEQLLKDINSFKVVVIKSTVPVGTCDEIEGRMWAALSRRHNTKSPGDWATVVSNPEFLREGRAVDDFLNADRVVVGGNSPVAISIVKSLYEPLQVPVIECDRRSSEMIKYASNAFLATKVSFINFIARLCEKLGADVCKVAEGMGHDHRIMPEHLRAGIGYGGSCFPKDVAALMCIANRAGAPFELLDSVVKINAGQVDVVIEKLEFLLKNLSGKVISVWGLAFKPNTDDTRDAPAIRLITELCKRGAIVNAYDPVILSMPEQKSLTLFDDPYAAVNGADALVLVTEWHHLLDVDFKKVRVLMEKAIIIDSRNCLDADRLLNLGFIYTGLGRFPLSEQN